jgi:hypothetical protein
MKEGLRLVFESGSASIPKRDQNGQLVSSAGAGYTTLDIVSLIGNDVAVSIRSLIGAINGNPYGPPSGTGTVFKAGWGGEFWVDPGVLKKAYENHSRGDTWQVARGPMTVGGQSVQVMSFKAGGGKTDRSELTYIFDEASGILVTQTTRIRKPDMSWHLSGYSRFLSMRQRNLPWAEGRPPAWLARISAYEYSGSQVWEIPGTPPNPIPVRLNFVRQKVGPNYVVLQARVPGASTGGTPPPQLVSGPTMVGGLWLPPLKISALRANQVIDEDPVTREKVYVQFKGRTQYGRNVVTIVSEAAGYITYADYEIETGMLLLMTSKDRVLNMSVQLKFTGKQRG